MFGKKKPKIEEIINEHIQVIPDEFYGGKDPVIYSEGTNRQHKPINTDLPRRVSYDPSWGGKLVNMVGSRVFKISILSILFVAVLAGISLYYFNQAGYKIWGNNTKTEELTVPPVVDTPMASTSTNVSETEIISTNTVLDITPSSTENEQIKVEEKYSFDSQPIDFPKSILGNSVDSDSDSLTDQEELVFVTDPEKWDTDGDGYYDGQEVLNLYNPKGLAPVKIIDSGLVREYVNPNWQYRLYYPATWIIGAVDKESRQVLFNSASGDYVEILAYEMQAGETFPLWFGRKAQGQNYTDLTNFINRFQESGFARKDGLVYYFVNDNRVFVLLYHSIATDSIAYRNMINMIAQNFRPEKTSVVIPEQTVLPRVPTTTE